jgi:MOSC domain-containing protein YiiM
MRGKILQINVSQGGIPKKPVPSAFVSFERVEGDDWRFKDVHGGPAQVILIIAKENIERLQSEGFPVFEGALGENLTTQGLDYKNIRYGDIFRAGESLEFRITKRRAPCDTLLVYTSRIHQAIFDADARDHKPESEKWGLSGFYAEILEEGTVRPGDDIYQINSEGGDAK